MDKIKTPLRELITELESELHHKNTRQGLKYAIQIAKQMLKREKEIMCWFADEWHEIKINKKF